MSLYHVVIHDGHSMVITENGDNKRPILKLVSALGDCWLFLCKLIGLFIHAFMSWGHMITFIHKYANGALRQGLWLAGSAQRQEWCMMGGYEWAGGKCSGSWGCCWWSLLLHVNSFRPHQNRFSLLGRCPDFLVRICCMRRLGASSSCPASNERQELI